MQRLVGAGETARADVDLAERGQRLGEPVRLADVILQRDRPLGQGNRLVVAVAQLGHRSPG